LHCQGQCLLQSAKLCTSVRIKAASIEFVCPDVLLNAATKCNKGNAICIVGIGEDIMARWSQEGEDSKLSLCGTLEFYAVKLEDE
jgi:hypothetical protein